MEFFRERCAMRCEHIEVEILRASAEPLTARAAFGWAIATGGNSAADSIGVAISFIVGGGLRAPTNNLNCMIA
jgi:hypothetical protein